jgi:hypothetical protein
MIPLYALGFNALLLMECLGRVVFYDEYDPFGTCLCAPSCQQFVSGIYQKALGRDVAIIIQRIKAIGNRMAACIANALRFFDPDLHIQYLKNLLSLTPIVGLNAGLINSLCV